MKLREIFRYELEHRLRSGSTWAYAGFLFLMAVWISLGTGADGDGGVHANAPAQLARVSILVGMFGMLVSAALFGDAAIRDVEVGMDPLLYTSPLRKAELLGGRFLGALAVNGLVVLAIPLGLLAMTGLLAFLGSEVLGPLRIGAYVQPLLLFLLPNLVLVGALLFAIGMLGRHMVPVYLAAIGVFIGYIVALNYASQIESPILAGLVDPLGLVALEAESQYWTEIERNSRLVGLPAALAWNRAFWLSAAAAVLGLLHGRFRFKHHVAGGRRWRKGRSPVSAPRADRGRAVEIPRVRGTFGSGTAVRQTLAIAGNSLAEVAGSRWFIGALLACVGLPLLWGWNVGDTVFDTSTWPVTLLVVEEVLAQRSVLLFMILVILFAGELLWKDREVGVEEIADAAPVPDPAALLGRFLALVAMIVMFQAAALVGGLLIQTLQGYYQLELGLYLRVVFGLKLADYVLLAALATTLHVVVNHKHLGHMSVLMALAFIALAGPLLGIQHHLLLYNTSPGWTYSDMNGFGPFAVPFAWFKLYWGAWALLLLVLACLFRVRGPESGMRRRLLQARARFTGPLARAAVLATSLILSLGGFIFYNTNVLNDYRSDDERGLPRAEYESRYGRYEDLPQPTLIAAELRVEIHPEEPAVEVRGSYRLVNRTDGAIDSVHVSLAPDILARSLILDRAAELVLVDEEVGYRIYALERALEPGDSLQLAFDVAFRPRGFPNSGIQTDVVGNGTSFNRMRTPFIGYQPLFELSGEGARQRFGLAPRPPMPGPEQAAGLEHRWAVRDADLVHVDAIIGTAGDQTAVTSGVLRRSWTENGRRYFHYATETPISFGGTIASAKYAVLEDQWNDVQLRIFHHPAHDSNLERMVAGMKASLELFTEQFGPYPYSDLRIVEVPRYGGFGSAHPHMILFTEDAFFSRVREGEVDQPFYGIAHEVAHTWWGGIVRGAPVRGAAFLSESLANYSAMLVTEKTYGPEAGRRVQGFQMERYLRGRATQSREVPVLEVEDQPYIAYRKGALALWTLRDHIGEEAVNGALRRYFERFSRGGPPYPTSLDLYAELRAVTPDSLRSLLTDWFETITLWDVRTERAVVEPTSSGEYVVTLDIVAKKLRADGEGNETEVSMDDLVEIGVFAEGQDSAPGEPLHLQRHRIRSGEQTIRLTVAQEPSRAGVDPYHKLIDRHRPDNVLEVKPVAGQSSAPGS